MNVYARMAFRREMGACSNFVYGLAGVLCQDMGCALYRPA